MTLASRIKSIANSFFVRSKKTLPRAWQWVGRNEKVILALLSVVIVVTGGMWYREFAQSRPTGPTIGGSYIEGIVNEQGELSQIATRLTKTGFFSFDSEGKLVNQLVENWESNSDKTEYVFTLNGEIDKEEIIQSLHENLPVIGPATIDSGDTQQIVISLQSPNPNLPLILSQPLFNYGAFKLSKNTAKTTIFSRNPREGAISPYLNKVIIHHYDNPEAVEQALSKRKLSGTELSDVSGPKQYREQSFSLPRYYTVLFNINKSPFRNDGTRRGLVSGNQVSAAFTLTVADKQPNKAMAEELVERWKNQGANVDLRVIPAAEIQEKVGPSRDFQVLLTGIDYGQELDPYYLWHSSQIRPPGNNWTGVKDDSVDRHLEAIRSTYNVKDRYRMIEELHQLLHERGIAFILRQESRDFILRDDVVFQEPWIAQGPADRYRLIADWYLR